MSPGWFGAKGVVTYGRFVTFCSCMTVLKPDSTDVSILLTGAKDRVRK